MDLQPGSREGALAGPLGSRLSEPDGDGASGARLAGRRVLQPGRTGADQHHRLGAPRAAAVAHVLWVAGAMGFWAYQDRSLWFFGDEWDFLVQRGVWRPLTGPHGLLYPHNEHWSTLPILLWRALFSVFHLSSYWPYLVPLLVAQALVAHLALRACLRAGASAWVATAAAGLLALLGAGAEDFTWAFQVGFVGSVLFGLLAVEMVERAWLASGPPAARDVAAAVASLLASLMCSTIGDAMVVGTALVALARLGVRRALVVAGVPTAVYALWFLVVGRQGLVAHSDHITTAVITAAPAYALDGLSSALGQSANLAPAGGALLVGLATWTALRAHALWQRSPAVLGLAAGAVAFYLLAALGRDATTVTPSVPRYVYVAMAMLTPLVAVLLSGTARSVRGQGGPSAATVGASVALLAFTALGNVSQATSSTPARVASVHQLEHEVKAAGYLLARGVTDVAGPGAAPVAADPNLSAATLGRLARAGELGSARPSPGALVNARTLLAMGTWDGSEMILTRRPLLLGRFHYVSSTYASLGAHGHGCMQFVPRSATQPAQIRLVPAGRPGGASVHVASPPAAPGSVDYLAAGLAPRQGPAATAPVELVVPGKGTGWLDDNDTGAPVVLTWDAGAPLTLCGLATRP